MEAKKEIRAFMDQYKVREYKETILLDNFEKISKIIADANYDGDVFKAQLLLIYDVCIRKELDQLQNNTNINQHFNNSTNFRSGLQCMNFFFDVINHISGYSEKFFDEVSDKINHEDLVAKYRAERVKV